MCLLTFGAKREGKREVHLTHCINRYSDPVADRRSFLFFVVFFQSFLWQQRRLVLQFQRNPKLNLEKQTERIPFFVIGGGATSRPDCELDMTFIWMVVVGSVCKGVARRVRARCGDMEMAVMEPQANSQCFDIASLCFYRHRHVTVTVEWVTESHSLSSLQHTTKRATM